MLENLEIVRQVDNQQIKKILYWCFFLGCFFLLILLYLRQPIEKVELKNDIHRLNNNLMTLKETNLKLRIEKQSLLDLSKVKKRARIMAPGFKKPEERQLIRVKVIKGECKIK